MSAYETCWFCGGTLMTGGCPRCNAVRVQILGPVSTPVMADLEAAEQQVTALRKECDGLRSWRAAVERFEAESAALKQQRDALALMVKLDGRLEALDEAKRVMAVHDAALVKPLEQKCAELAAALLSKVCLDEANEDRVANGEGRDAAIAASEGDDKYDATLQKAKGILAARDAEQRRQGAVKALRRLYGEPEMIGGLVSLEFADGWRACQRELRKLAGEIERGERQP